MAITAAERYPSCDELIAAAWALLTEPAAPPPDGATGPAHAVEAVVERVATPRDALGLTVRDGLGRGLALAVDNELVLGRLTTLDGALAPDHSISRRHARITRRSDGAFEVVDEHSRNGTFVNGDRLETPRVLRTGDELKIGGTVFVASAPIWMRTTRPRSRHREALRDRDSPARSSPRPGTRGRDSPCAWSSTPTPVS